MYILKICPTPFFSDRGCHVRILEQTKTLCRLGHRVTICTYNSGRDIPSIDIRRIKDFAWRRNLETGPDLRKYYLDIFLFFKAFLISLRKRPDIIHAHLHEGAAIAYPIARLFRIPLVLDLQGSLTDEMIEHRFIKERTLPFYFNYWLEKKTCLMADIILASSINLTTFLKNKFGLNTSKVELIEEGIGSADTLCGKTHFLEDMKKLRVNIPEKTFVILYLGLLYPYQGIDDFLKAAKELIKNRKDIHFLVIGFPYEERYRQMIREEGLENFFTFTGKVPYEKIPDFILFADIAVSPKVSRTESNSKLYHFMAYGIPAVAYDLPVNRKILGDCGIYVKPGNVEGLALEVEKLLEDEDLRRDISLKLRARAADFASWCEIGKKIEAIYCRLRNG